MLFNFDPLRLARQLCPPILRSKVLMALLKAICAPLRFISEKIFSYRKDVKDGMSTTSNVVVLEGVLNETFYLQNKQIYITTNDSTGEVFFRTKQEDTPIGMHTLGESQSLILLTQFETIPGPDFTIHIPSFLATSLVPDVDEYNGVNLLKITDIINRYKPVGKTYALDIYTYE